MWMVAPSVPCFTVALKKERILFLSLYRNFIFLVGPPLNSSLKVPVLWIQADAKTG